MLKEQLIILEETFITSILSEFSFQTLQGIYSLLIAYYDQMEDPIRDYFLEKNTYINSKKGENVKKTSGKLPKADQEIKEESCSNNLWTHKQLRFKKMNLAKELKELKLDERDLSVDKLLKRHLNEESRLTEFIKKEQIAQEQSFRLRLDSIRERRAELSLNELPRTVCSVKDHLVRRRGRATTDICPFALDFSDDDSSHSERQSSDSGRKVDD